MTIGTEQGDGSGSGSTIVIRRNNSQRFCDSLDPRSGTWSDNLVLPKFDSGLGTLTSAELTFEDFFTANLSLEHTSPQSAASYTAFLTGGVIIYPPENGPFNSTIFFTDSDSIAPFDGVIDFIGPSGRSFLNITNSESHTYFANNLSMYQSATPENLLIPVQTTSFHKVTGPGDFDTRLRTLSSASACITYDYETITIIPGGGGGGGNEIEANCKINQEPSTSLFESCNVMILEETVPFNPEIMQFYECMFTVETPESMYGEYFITVEAEDLDGLISAMDENEYWFLNPVIGLSIEGDMTFSEVRPGTSSYSETMLLTNDADMGSGVLLDMFISGTDFYDSSSSGAMCPTTNQLKLENFRYFASNGAYSTYDDLEIDNVDSDRNCDNEGYCNIEYGIGFNNPLPFYDNAEIMQVDKNGAYYHSNLLNPGADMALTFKLNLPEPCNGDFDTGSIFFWGEAV